MARPRNCTDWFLSRRIIATCPYCSTVEKYYCDADIGDFIHCKKCKKKFKLAIERGDNIMVITDGTKFMYGE